MEVVLSTVVSIQFILHRVLRGAKGRGASSSLYALWLSEVTPRDGRQTQLARIVVLAKLLIKN